MAHCVNVTNQGDVGHMLIDSMAFRNVVGEQTVLCARILVKQ